VSAVTTRPEARVRGGTRVPPRLALTAVVAFVLPVLGLVGWAGYREVEAQRARLVARQVEAAEADLRARLSALADDAAARVDRALAAVEAAASADPGGLEASVRRGAVRAVVLDEEGRVVAPALPAAAGRADAVPAELAASIGAARDLEHRFRDPESAIRHYARLLDERRDAPAQARILCELAATHAALESWPAAATVADRALALEADAPAGDGRHAGLLGARDHVHLGLLRVEALVRVGERERARAAALPLARELALGAAARSFAGASFGLRRLREVLGADPLPAAIARLDRAVGGAAARGALGPAVRRARASTSGTAVLRVAAGSGGDAGVGAGPPLALVAIRALRTPAGGGEPARFVVLDAGLGEVVDGFAGPVARPGVRLSLCDPDGAAVLDLRADGEGGRDPAAAPAGTRTLALGGPFAGWSVEFALAPGAEAARAAARQTRLLLGVIVACGLAVAGAATLFVRGAARSIALERARSDFVAGVTHDLKTPLALVRMYAETLRLGRADGADERDRFLDVIIREADRLHDLVQNVLAFQRRGLAPRLADRDLGATLREAVSGFAPSPEVDVRVVLDPLPGDLPPVPHDRSAVERIVRNLLANALGFAPAGSAVRVRAVAADGGVRLEVADEGPGIPEDLLPRVFEPFVTAPRPGAARGGTGLGLTVVRDLAAAHRGYARLRPNRPRGVVAEVWLPGGG